MIDRRPDPDTLLLHVQKAEQQKDRGELKIFLGYVAGVGKTYAMLEAAHQRMSEGLDVVAAYIETHGRAETEQLLNDLEVIPRQQVTYRGVTLPELDLDAVVTRRPQIALVDELAHSNAPGSWHAKRYQDVLEMLAVGIDVYTTLNIQHLESLNDVVARITGVIVRETIPDRILNEANDIELIDLPTDELLQRLDEGKVYIPDQAKRAAAGFFRKGNLTALRELALRRAADRVDEQMRAYMQTHAIEGPWPATDRVLVCVSASPLGEKLVRAAGRLALRLNAEWYAVYVETPDQTRLSEEERNRITKTLNLAATLGANTVTLAGRSLVGAILPFAQSHNVTKIVAGKPLRSRWREVWHGSIIEQIVRSSGDIDVYVISSHDGDRPERVRSSISTSSIAWTPYWQSAGLVLLATLIGLPLRPLIEPTNLVMLYLLAVIVAALYLGQLPAMLASVLSVVTFNFIFVPPYYTFVVANAQYILTFAALLIVGIVISRLTAQARDQAQAAQRRATETLALYELSRSLSSAADMSSIAQALTLHLEQTLDCRVVVLVPDGQDHARLVTSIKPSDFHLSDHELAVATWVWQHAEPAGHGTNTLAGARGHYLPLTTVKGVAAVLGIQFKQHDVSLSPEQRRLLQSFANQTAQAIERVQLSTQAQEAQLLKETEKLHTTLLNSISHDLRTPLASITGALSSLREDAAYLSENDRSLLVNTAQEQADALNRLVGNLLDMTRLDSGAVKVKREPCDVQDVIGVALAQLEERIGDRRIAIDIAPDVPLDVSLDFMLIVQALVNLIDNALKYSPTHEPIIVRARLEDAAVVIEVIDRGIGIPPDETEHIFDKFYRIQRHDKASGTGLGLSICKGVAEAHGGSIQTRPNPGGGTIMTLTIPLEDTYG